MKKSVLSMTAAGIAILIGAFALMAVHTQAAQPAAGKSAIPLQVKTNIRAVFQINDDEKQRGLSKGLLHIRRLLEIYKDAGIDPKEIHLVAVLHGKAAQFLLKDEAFQNFNQVADPNPNKKMVTDLSKAGVSIEMERTTMKQNEWTDADLLPEVGIVEGVHARVIDLQLQGYANIQY